jgi:hypothetical protein
MLNAMKKHATEQQVRAKVKKLRTETDPKFAQEMNVIADSLDGLINAASLMGQKGGVARAQKLSKKRRSEIARNAANVRWGK